MSAQTVSDGVETGEPDSSTADTAGERELNGTPSTEMCVPEQQEIRGDADVLNAHATIPGGSLIRIIGNDTDEGWVEAVEVGRPGAWERVTDGCGLEPAQRYNTLVDELAVEENQEWDWEVDEP